MNLIDRPNQRGSGSFLPQARPAEGEVPNLPSLGHEAAHSPAEMNVAEIVRILLAWRWLILGSLTVGMVAAVVITLLTTPLYRAVATLEVSAPQQELIEGADVGTPNQDRNFLATQYGLLESRSLATRVAQELNLASNPDFASGAASRSVREKAAIGRLREHFAVEPVINSRLVEISYVSESPELAARVTNSFAENFIASGLERRYEASTYARNFLERRIAAVKADLERSERLMVGYAQRQGIVNTGGEAGVPLDTTSLDLVNRAWSEAQTARIEAENRYRQALSRETTSETINNPTVQSLRSQRASLESEYQEKLNLFRPDYPDMVRLKSRIDALGEQIRAESGNVISGRTNSLKLEYQAAAAEEQSLRQRVEDLKSRVLDLRGRTIRYNILQRELDTNRALYDALLQRYKEIGVAGGIGPNLVSIVDRAQVPGSLYRPNLILNLIVGLTLGAILGLGTAFVLEFVNDTIKTPEDVRTKLKIPSLGAIPMKQKGVSMVDELSDLTSPVSEAYFSLRTALQFTTPGGAPRLLLVTSTRASEGKSSTTMALAQNFARLGQSVLLVDGDMRKPAFVARSGASNGLSTLLTSAGTLEEQVLKTRVSNLFLLPCGPLPPNPAELLASPQLQKILRDALSQFDMVIIDGPPVLGLADAPLLSSACEGTLIVIESGKTRRPAVVEAMLRLKSAGAKILGAVLTKYTPQTSGYGYNYEPYRYGGGITDRDRQIELLPAAAREA